MPFKNDANASKPSGAPTTLTWSADASVAKSAWVSRT